MAIINTQNAKKSILSKIKNALKEEAVAQPFPDLPALDTKTLFVEVTDDDLVQQFVDNYQASGGQIILAEDMTDALAKLNSLVEEHDWKNVMCAQKDLFSYFMSEKVPYIKEYDIKYDGVDACITDCEMAIARTGSFILTSNQN